MKVQRAMSKYDLVLYDLDGTLWDSIPLIMECYKKAYDVVLGGTDRSDDDLQSYIGRPLGDTFSMHDDETRDKLAALLEDGITADERAKRFCELFGVLNTEFVNLYGEEEWADMGPDERDPAFEMLLEAIADRVPDFTGKFNALRAEIEAIPMDAFVRHEHLGMGDKIRDILSFAIAQEA